MINSSQRITEKADQCNSSALKRVSDIVLSITFLILFSPLILFAALLIKLTSKGPVFYIQKRVGLNDSRFSFIKLRSMEINSDQNVHERYSEALIKGYKDCSEIGKKGIKVYKLIEDPRITPIGRIIRKFSIDEIPQFFNVLKGEMSVVGPRPALPYDLKFYTQRARKRLLVKPGMTGLWQVDGRSTTTFRRMVALDLFYIGHWSIWLDLKIILRTFFAIFDIDKAY